MRLHGLIAGVKVITMTPIDLYKQAGEPKRAIIKLSEPTKVWTGLRRNSVKTEFEAWVTLGKTGTLGYFLNPNSYHCFYMPENVIEFIPVDEMELWKRAKYAAKCIIDGRTHGRELDNAFENYDGEEMCAALWRMAQRSKKLKSQIEKTWNSTLNFEENYRHFFDLSDKELSEHAQKTRTAVHV
jgi:hypothetical protein